MPMAPHPESAVSTGPVTVATAPRKAGQGLFLLLLGPSESGPFRETGGSMGLPEGSLGAGAQVPQSPGHSDQRAP